jgi:hypothetical protein
MRALLIVVVLAALTVLSPGVMLASALVLLVANRLPRGRKTVPLATLAPRALRPGEALERRFSALG